ncbi:HET domain containing protein [Rhypophila decipiens]
MLQISSSGRVPWIGIAPRTQTGGIRDLERAVAWTKSRLEVCERDHKCRQRRRRPPPVTVTGGNMPRLPTRVLDLGKLPGRSDLKLDADLRLYVSQDGEVGQYVALSHCWGKLQLITTTKDTIDLRTKDIKFEELTRTFQDAVKVTRQLGIRYLWIDSLCIVQDDQNDWLREAAKMVEVYSEAHLTIAATAGSDGNSGLFRGPGEQPVAGDYYTELKTQLKGPPLGDGREDEFARLFIRRCLPHGAFFKFDPNGLPLLTRAWVFQERLLSARVVHFVQDELVWECREKYACECGEAHARGSNRGTVKQGDAVGRSETEWRAKDDSYPSRWHREDPDNDEEQEGSLYADFCGLVSAYSQLRLTYEKDRLAAFAGIARTLYSSGSRSGGESEYLAGHWKESLAHNLTWQVREPTVPFSAWPQRPEAAAGAGSDEYVAPTWSWASTPGSFYNLQLLKDTVQRFKVVIAQSVTRGTDRFGPILDASLVLSGSVRDVQLQTWRRQSGTRRVPLIDDDLDSTAREDVQVRVSGDRGSFSVVRLDFAPDWDEEGGRGEPRERWKEWELTGECPDMCQLLYLTNRSAMLLKHYPRTSIYRRVGVYFEFDSVEEGQYRTLRIV